MVRRGAADEKEGRLGLGITERDDDVPPGNGNMDEALKVLRQRSLRLQFENFCGLPHYLYFRY